MTGRRADLGLRGAQQRQQRVHNGRDGAPLGLGPRAVGAVGVVVAVCMISWLASGYCTVLCYSIIIISARICRPLLGLFLSALFSFFNKIRKMLIINLTCLLHLFRR